MEPHFGVPGQAEKSRVMCKRVASVSWHDTVLGGWRECLRVMRVCLRRGIVMKIEGESSC